MTMRSFGFTRFTRPLLVLALFFGALSMAPAQLVINKAANNTALTNASSWVGGVVPGPNDIQQWDNPPISGGNGPSIGASMTNGQIRELNPAGSETISASPGATLTLNGVGGRGLDLRSGYAAMTLGCNVALGAPQQWDVNNDLTATAAVNNNGYALRLQNWYNSTLACQISGAGSLASWCWGRTLTLNSTNTYTGNTILYNGAMLLDFSAAGAPANNIINNTVNSSALDFEGNATLNVTGKSGSTINQQFNGVYLNHGGAIFVNNANGANLTLALGAITETNNSSVDFQPGTTGVITTTSASLGPWATVNSCSDFATVSAGTITGLNAAVTAESGWAGGDYTFNNGGANITLSGARSANTLRNSYISGATIVDITNNNLTVNALVNGVTNATPALTVKSSSTGKVVIGPSGSLYLGGPGSGYAAALLTVSAPISGSGNLVKMGPDDVYLSANNTFTGSVVVNAGTLMGNLPFTCGVTNNTIVLQGGIFGTFNSASLRIPQYSGMVWAGDCAIGDGENSNGYMDLNGTPITISNGTRGVTSYYFNPGLILDAAISDNGNNYGLTIGGGGNMLMLGKNTYTGPTTLFSSQSILFADKGQALLNNNFVLQGGTVGPVFNPDYGLTLGSGAGQIQFCPGRDVNFSAGPYSYLDVNFNSGANLIQSSTPYFLLGGISKQLYLYSYNGHCVVWRNPIQVTTSGGVATTLKIWGNGGVSPATLATGYNGYDAMLVGDITQAGGVAATLAFGNSVHASIVYAGAGNYGVLSGGGNVLSAFIPTRSAGIPAGCTINNTVSTLAPRAGATDEWTSAQLDGLVTTLNGLSSVNLGMDVGATPFSYNLGNYNNGGGTKYFSKFGPGTLTVSGTPTYTGATIINQGTLALTAAGNIPGSLGFSNVNARLDNVSGSLIDYSAKSVTLYNAFNATANYFGGNGNIRLPGSLGLTASSSFANLGSAEVNILNPTIGNYTYQFAGATLFSSVTGSGATGGLFRLSGLTRNAGNGANTAILAVDGATVILDGASTITSTTGVDLINCGTLVLDYTTNTSSKISSDCVIPCGGTLEMLGNATGGNNASETLTMFYLGTPTTFFNGSAYGNGTAEITLQTQTNGGNLTLNLGALNRSSQMNQRLTIDFNPITNGTATATITTTSGNTSGILNPWVSFQRNTWATGTGSTPYTIAGLTSFDLNNAFDTTSTHNINITSAYNADPGAGVNENTVRIAAGLGVTISNRSYAAGGTMVWGASDTDTTLADTNTFSPGYMWVNSTKADGVTPGRVVLNASLANAIVTKAGAGTLTLSQPSPLDASTFYLNEGTVELAADNALGSGNLYLGDFSGLSGFAAVGGPRTISNSTYTTTANWYVGTLRGVRFSGTNDITIAGMWQAPYWGDGAAGVITMDSSANVIFQPGANANAFPGLLMASDGPGCALSLIGTGTGTLRFTTPILRGISGNAGVLNLQRPNGITQLDQGIGLPVVNINKGVLITKGTIFAPLDRTKTPSVYANGVNTITVPETTGLNVGMCVYNSPDATAGAYITAINGNVLTLNRNMVNTRVATDNYSQTFMGIAPAGTQQTYVGPQGVLGLGVNIPVPATLTSLSCGVIGIETNGYTQNLDLASFGNGEMYLGSATTGNITGGTVLAGIHNTYRLGGGGGKLTLSAANLLTGANGVMVGNTNLFKGSSANGEVIFAGNQNYTGTTLANAGKLTLNGSLTGNGPVVIGNGNLTVNSASNTIGSLTFQGSGVLAFGSGGTSTGSLLLSNSIYSVSAAQNDINAGHIVTGTPGRPVYTYRETINGTVYTFVGNPPTPGLMVLFK